MYQRLKMDMHVGDIKIRVWGKNRELPRVTMKVFEKDERSSHERGIGALLELMKTDAGKSEMITTQSSGK